MNTHDKNSTINREAAIIGCGEYGYAILNSMKTIGFTLNVMDINPDSFQKFSGMDIKNGSIIPMVGNGMSINDLSILPKDISIIVVMTGDDSINLFIGQLSKFLFRTAKIICKINNEKIMLLGKNQGILTFSTTALLNETILSVI